MINHNTTEVFFDNLEVPPENLIGEEGRGFRYILDGMNAERILVAQECIGDGRWLLQKGIATKEVEAAVVEEMDPTVGLSRLLRPEEGALADRPILLSEDPLVVTVKSGMLVATAESP